MGLVPRLGAVPSLEQGIPKLLHISCDGSHTLDPSQPASGVQALVYPLIPGMQLELSSWHLPNLLGRYTRMDVQ